MLENRALEIIIIALVVMVLFGAKRLPDSARALGKSLRILKAETHALRTDTTENATEPATPPAAPQPTPAPLTPAGNTEQPTSAPAAQPHHAA